MRMGESLPVAGCHAKACDCQGKEVNRPYCAELKSWPIETTGIVPREKCSDEATVTTVGGDYGGTSLGPDDSHDDPEKNS